MTRPGALGALGLFLVTGPVGAQANPPSVGLAMVAVASQPAFGGIGPSAVFPLSAVLAVSAAAAVGRRGPDLVGRGEVALRLQFTARAEDRVRWYGLGGIAGVTGRSGGGFLLLALGAERGAVGCWWGEMGVGGGVRVALGYRHPVGRLPPVIEVVSP